MAKSTTKTDLVDIISSKEGVTKVDAKRILDSFIETVKEELGEGRNVMLVGFGTWSTSQRPARKGRNPQTGAQIDIPEKTVVKHKVKF